MPPAVSASIEATTRRCLDILLNLFEQNTQCNLHNKSIAHYKYLSDINIYQCQYIADIRYQCSAVLGCRDRLGGDRDCLGSGPGPCRVGGGTVPGGRGVEGWCGGTGRHSVGKARHRHGKARECHGKARECHGMARECYGGGTADGVPRTFQNNLVMFQFQFIINH